VSLVCRLTIVVALMLHLIFGCSLHHAAMCQHHDHDQCRHMVTIEPLSTHCNHDHDCSGEGKGSEGKTIEVSDGESRLVAPCCDCEFEPCGGDQSGCHAEVECSFVPSSDVIFVMDAPFVAYVTYDHDPMMNLVGSMAKRESLQRSARLATNSLFHCASLCTWII